MLREIFTVKKIILLIVLAALLCFLFFNRYALENEDQIQIFDEGAKQSVEVVSMTGSQTVVQPFVAQHNKISNVEIRFDIKDKANAKGKFIVEIRDKDNKKIARTKLDASYIKPSVRTAFLFSDDSEAANSNRFTSTYQRANRNQSVIVNKGEEYQLIVRSDRVTEETGVDLHVIALNPEKNDNKLSGDMIMGDKELENTCVSANVTYRDYNKKVIAMILILVLFAALLILLPLERINNRFSKLPELNALCLRIMFFLTPIVSYVIIAEGEAKSFHEIATTLLSIIGLLNLLIVGLLWWLIYTIVNRIKWTILITTGIIALYSFTNYVLVMFRDSPLIATDFGSIGTAFAVAGSYTVELSRAGLWIIILTVVWICLAVSLKGHKGLPLKKRLIPLIILALWGSVFYYTFFKSDIISKHHLYVSGFKAHISAETNGYALSFIITIRNSIVDKPEGYSIDTVKQLTKQYPSDKADKPTKATESAPNVIVVMNEAYSDLAVLGDFETNKDYMPFYHNLKENTVKGWMHSSVYGGSTANSEFEFLTGFSLKSLPYRSSPYRSQVKDVTPSLTYLLEERGYSGDIAFHPGMVNSYTRDKVYPLLGFKKHISIDDLKDPEYVRDYVSDEYDYGVVEEEYEKVRKSGDNAPFYLFNVTIQNHGGYAITKGEVDEGIKILEQEHSTEMAGTFLNLMKVSDNALEGLINYFSNVDEPTVIVLFGDHQPRLEPEFYQSFSDQHKDMSDIERGELKYRVPFMIWANYDIEEKEDVEISANYIASYVLKMTGSPMSGYDKYLMDLYEEYPVISANCCMDSDGNMYDVDEKIDSELFNLYPTVQYNGLVDRKNRVEEFFNLK